MIFSFQEKNSNKNELSIHEKIGFAVRCMLYNRNYSLYPVLTIQIWTEFAINHDQIKFLFDTKGMPLAYITWAYIAPDTEERLINDPEFRLHLSEWGSAPISSKSLTFHIKIIIYHILNCFIRTPCHLHRLGDLHPPEDCPDL